MTIRTYVAQNAQEASRKALAELGKDAIILKIRPVQGKGLWRMAGRQQVELQACSAADLSAPPKRRPPPVAEPPAAPDRLARAYGAPAARAGAPGALRDEVKSLSDRVDRVMTLLQDQTRSQRSHDLPDVTEGLQEHYTTLLEREVAPAMARRLVRQVNEALRGEELRNPVLVRAQLRQAIESLLRYAGPVQVPGDRPRIVALVGPTGVGKTTTIAKLATHYRYKKGKRVGLVTIDTYRMGAREQSQQYAELLNVPIRVALTPGELRRALQEMANRDLILIDTAGYSQKDLLKLNEVRAFLAAARPDETHLVVSCTTDSRVVRHVLEVYKALQINRILLTKLDEAVAFGMILDLATTTDHPFSYATQGQEVTEEIGLGEPGRMARLILGEELP